MDRLDIRASPEALALIDITSLLATRPSRPPEHARQNQAMSELAEVLANDPERIARCLSYSALRLTGAHSAGLSLEEPDRSAFRWIATSGDFRPHLNQTLPRQFSPCGEVLARSRHMLLRDPAQVYGYIENLDVPVREVLLVPFFLDGKPVGTVWVASRDESRAFDSEDLRIVRDLTHLAGAAAQTVGMVKTLKRANAAKQIELSATLRQVKQLQQWLQQSPGFLAYLRGPEFMFELSNAEFHRVSGVGDVLGKSLFDALPRLRGQGFRELLDQVRTTGRPYKGRAVPVVLAGQDDDPPQTRYFDFVFQPIPDEFGGVDGIVAQGYECTDRVRTVEVMREADQRKDEFFAMLSHEMRTPLAAITLASHVVKRSLPAGDPVAGRLAVIERQAAHLTALADDLIDVTSIRSGKFQLRPEVVLAQDIASRAAEACASHLSARNQQLDMRLPDESIALFADPLRLTQAIVNLVNNAIKYSPAGSRIALTLTAASGLARFEVADSGIGIAPELLPRVFDMFMQVPVADRPRHSGLGIGLALVRQIVELHGGRVEASSPGVDQGSCFTVVVPQLCEADASQAMRIRPNQIRP
ncbi:MAG TPA: ATP-binding protein [Burkholderiaceae bacterium]|nr:ATP-binding protein [Burkholderiaceae bacterium]